MRKFNLILSALVLSVVVPHVGHAKSVKDQLVGAWTLVEGSEIKPDGTRVNLWAKGSLIVDKSGHLSFFVIAKDRAKTENVRVPAGPIVAWYGTYTVDEAGKKYTAKIEGSSFVPFEGSVREQTVKFGGGTMTTTGSKVSTPEGEITPVNVWKKVN